METSDIKHQPSDILIGSITVGLPFLTTYYGKTFSNNGGRNRFTILADVYTTMSEAVFEMPLTSLPWHPPRGVEKTFV